MTGARVSDVSVRARVYGEDVEFTASRGQQTVLEAARDAGVDLPFMCESGTCATCRAKLVRGEVSMANNFILDDDELAAGFVLGCQAVPQSGALELDFDEGAG